MDKNLKKQNRWGKKEGEKPDTQVDDAHLGMGQLKWRNVNKKVVFPIVLWNFIDIYFFLFSRNNVSVSFELQE